MEMKMEMETGRWGARQCREMTMTMTALEPATELGPESR